MKPTSTKSSNGGSGSKPDSKTGLPARLIAARLLTRVVDDQRNLDSLCDHENGLREFLQLSDKDRSLARAIVITACRNRTKILKILEKLQDRAPPKRARYLFHALHVAAAQIMFMDVPPSAAVDLAVTAIANEPRTARFKSFANAVLRRMVNEQEELYRLVEPVSPFPKWMEKSLRKDYGKEKLARISSFVSLPPNLDVSVKSHPDFWADRIGGISLPNGSVRIRANQSVPDLPGFETGDWWVQDVAASLPANLVNVGAGSQVLELCAAPGGKTAQLVNAGYKVTALDISQKRLNRMQENLKRLSFEVNAVQADILEWETNTQFDAVLIDAPCSSTGTVRRHPDVLWTKSPQDITELAALQRKLIRKAVHFVKPGGILVFSNCSIFKEEGENLLETLLKDSPSLKLDPIEKNEMSECSELINGQGAVRSLPFNFPNSDEFSQGGMDGFFACRFLKTV